MNQGNTYVKGQQGSPFFFCWIIPIWPKRYCLSYHQKKKKILNPLSPPAKPFTYDPLYVQTPQKSWLLHLLPSNPAFVPKHLIKATLADITNEFFQGLKSKDQLSVLISLMQHFTWFYLFSLLLEAFSSLDPPGYSLAPTSHLYTHHLSTSLCLLTLFQQL